MDLGDNRVPLGIRLALQERFTDCLGCQISETDMVTDILSYLLDSFESVQDATRQREWSPEEVLIQLDTYLGFISHNCKHNNSYGSVMAQAMAKLGKLINMNTSALEFIKRHRDEC